MVCRARFANNVMVRARGSGKRRGPLYGGGSLSRASTLRLRAHQWQPTNKWTLFRQEFGRLLSGCSGKESGERVPDGPRVFGRVESKNVSSYLLAVYTMQVIRLKNENPESSLQATHGDCET